MPVYNEEGAIKTVLDKWIKELNSLKIDYELHVYNDGSTDNTLSILNNVARKNSKLKIHDKKNSGHGPTILLGYRENVASEWIFQVDSDDEMGPEQFNNLWKNRGQYDFLIGCRDGRNSPLPRKIVSLIAKTTVQLFYGRGVSDVNSPYRLMKSEKFKDLFSLIPDDTFAPNLIISGYACKKKMNIFKVDVSFKERQTGTVSIKKWKLLKAAMKSFMQTIKFSGRSI